jgi:hypothetical protein
MRKSYKKKSLKSRKQKKRTLKKQRGGSVQTPITIEQAKNMGVVVNPTKGDESKYGEEVVV